MSSVRSVRTVSCFTSLLGKSTNSYYRSILLDCWLPSVSTIYLCKFIYYTVILSWGMNYGSFTWTPHRRWKALIQSSLSS